MDDGPTQDEAFACGAPFTGDDGKVHTCTLLAGHPSGHTDIPAPPADGGDR
jgi:hypothetical protein